MQLTEYQFITEHHLVMDAQASPLWQPCFALIGLQSLSLGSSQSYDRETARNKGYVCVSCTSLSILSMPPW